VRIVGTRRLHSRWCEKDASESSISPAVRTQVQSSVGLYA
jgi:hypothetical protein